MEVSLNQHTFPNRTTAAGLTLILLLTACGSGGEQQTPTMSVEEIQTQAVATFAADLTATALSVPTETPTATETPAPTATSTPERTNTPSGFASPAGVQPAGSCYGLAFVSDVTIPDNTTMTPGQKFTKTWRVRNSGSCAWEKGFKFNFIGGEAMGGSSVSLVSAVQPGNETDLSVDLTAPSTQGTYRGNWRMTNASGAYFGDEVYVLIVVSGATPSATVKSSATLSSSPTATMSPTETPTETEVPQD
jgi:hypothetical protein